MPGFEDQHLMPLIRHGRCCNCAASARADDDHINLFRDGIMADKDFGF